MALVASILLALAVPAAALPTPFNLAPRQTCTQGAWQCQGADLQMCNWGEWATMATCNLPGMACSATGVIGCVWSFQVPLNTPSSPVKASSAVSSAPSVIPSEAASSPLPSSSEVSASASSAQNPPSSVPTSDGSESTLPSASATAVPPASTSDVAIPSSAQTSASESPAASTAPSSSQAPPSGSVGTSSDVPSSTPTESASSVPTSAGSVEPTNPIASSIPSSQPSGTGSAISEVPSITPSAPSPAEGSVSAVPSSPTVSGIEGTPSSALPSASEFPSASSTPVSSSEGNPSGNPSSAASTSMSLPAEHPTSASASAAPSETVSSLSASGTPSVSASPSESTPVKTTSTAASASSTSSSRHHGHHSSASASVSTPVSASASASASASESLSASESTSVSASASASTASAPASASASEPASASASASHASASASPTSSSPSSTSSAPAPAHTWSAPHYVIYSDAYFTNGKLPTAAELGQFNRLLLAFDLLEGPWDNALMWTQMAEADRQSIIDEYHAAGIALMVAAFGATDVPTSVGADPVATAKSLADFAKKYKFDGVDVDYEDFQAFAGGTAAKWLVSFQKELRSQLGPSYLISHAPVAPWFDDSAYSDGAYDTLFKEAGDTVDWFNLQYYNQYTAFTDCQSLIFDSSSTQWPGVSIKELHEKHGIPYSKLVLGKPIATSQQTNGGYMEPSALATCVKQGKDQLGWDGGVMFWQWISGVNAADVIKTVIG